MDAVQQFLQQEHLPVPQKFILSGVSKVRIILQVLIIFYCFFQRGWAS
jgi:hypothetical protein